jgi:small subunit ribosomal protein S17
MPKRILQGVVVSNANEKTAVVRVERRVKHPVYDKIIRRSKRYQAHDEGNKCQIGDLVQIEECPPISRHKRWRVLDANV